MNLLSNLAKNLLSRIDNAGKEYYPAKHKKEENKSYHRYFHVSQEVFQQDGKLYARGITYRKPH